MSEYPEDLSEAELRLRRNGEDEQYLLDCARIGIDVHAFTKTRAGKHLFDMAMKDLQDALFRLLDEADVTSATARQAHFQARTARATLDYIGEAIDGGRVAEQRLQELDELENQHHE